MAKSIMIQGTGSNVGKSVIVCGLCRIMLEDGYDVAPFKTQNMSNNSFVTSDGFEIARSQANQACACRIAPDVRMNPILIKPLSGMASQLMVMGKPAGNMSFGEYAGKRSSLLDIVAAAYESLASEHEVIVIEGAGSPAEVNLMKHDIVNMHTAEIAGAPVILAGDIDNGGLFASFVGHLDIFDDSQRRRTAGFIINKFRGDIGLLQPGIDWLESRTGKRVFGVVPMMDIRIPEEDSVSFKRNVGMPVAAAKDDIRVAIVDMPHISNFTDLDAFSVERDVCVYSTADPEALAGADIVIFPGTRNVMEDIVALKDRGFEERLLRHVEGGGMLVGICGGYQMLGKTIGDPLSIESSVASIRGFGFLDMDTVLEKDKVLAQVRAECPDCPGAILHGYEIHHGRSDVRERPFLLNAGDTLGCISADGNVWGTYIHGIFDNDGFRRMILDAARKKKGLDPIVKLSLYGIESGIADMARALRECLDMNAIYSVMGLR